jgi:hypothetical protein
MYWQSTAEVGVANPVTNVRIVLCKKMKERVVCETLVRKHFGAELCMGVVCLAVDPRV